MPITKFKCPDGKTILCEDCIKKCRMRMRCTSPCVPAYVHAHQREYKGKLSVTEVLNPTTQIYLKITQPNTVTLERHLYSMIGTVNHLKHEEGGVKTPSIENEIALEDDLNYGTTDMLECIDGKYYLRDIKNKKCAQMKYLLDCKTVGEKEYALHSSLQKGIKLKQTDDVVIQLNRYRMMIEKQRGIQIEGMFADFIIIDWSPKTSPEKWGLKWQSYSVPVPFVNDDRIMERYIQKDKEVKDAIKNGVTKFCYECADWKRFGADEDRCKLYCDCSESCKNYFYEQGKTNKFLE